MPGGARFPCQVINFALGIGSRDFSKAQGPSELQIGESRPIERTAPDCPLKSQRRVRNLTTLPGISEIPGTSRKLSRKLSGWSTQVIRQC